jgi:hypothetical protein
MSLCICPDDPQKVSSDKRVYLYEPDASRRDGMTTVTDTSKVHIFHADCPVHGYTVLEDEKGTTIV